MTCKEALALIPRHVEQGLGGAARERLEDHLGHCQSCRQTARAQVEVIGILRVPMDEPVPLGFVERVAERISSDGDWLHLLDWQVWTYRLAPVAASVILLATFLFGQPVRGQSVEFSRVVEALAVGDQDPALPVTALFWQPDVNDESLLTVVLTATSDGFLEEYADEQ